MAKAVDFYFDVGSPAAYIAWTQLPKICNEAGATITYKPMLLGGVFHATGNHSPTTVPAKGQYMMEDLARFARRYGVPFKHNPYFPINTLTLMRGAAALQLHDAARFQVYSDAMFRAIWVDGKDMNDPATVAAALHAAGFDPQVLLTLAGQPDVKERLKAVTREAVERGVFGAPTFFVDGQMHWGQDRLDFVKQALEEKA